MKALEILIGAWRKRASETENRSARELVDAYQKGIGDGRQACADELETTLRESHGGACEMCEGYRVAIDEAIRVLTALTVADINAINALLSASAPSPSTDGSAAYEERRRIADLQWKLTFLGQRIERSLVEGSGAHQPEKEPNG